MQQLHCIRRENERQPATIEDSERHAATPWHWEIKTANIGDSERHAATLWYWKR